jgi:hypothetical protein
MQPGDSINIHKYDNGYRVTLDPKWIDGCTTSNEPAQADVRREWNLIFHENDLTDILDAVGDELARED